MTGAITPYLKALSLPEDDESVQALIAKQTGELELETFKSPYAHYKEANESGVTFLFGKAGLEAVFFQLIARRSVQAYSADQLIDGLEMPPTMAEIHSAFGEPYRSKPEYFDLYDVDGRVVHFEYDMDMKAHRITVMAEDVQNSD